MPVRLHLLLTGPPPRAGQVVEYRHVNGVRAWVYDAVAQVDAAFAQAMHDDAWPKPPQSALSEPV